MQYKGEDLDLRVPQARAPREAVGPDYDSQPGNGRWSRGRAFQAGGSEPLWVDEVLLACCNYAFDVAQANGAAEVGLEHLANALTRVEAAARTLEGRGVHEGQLRRESAALIASEIPAANAGEAVAPRRSPDLEDVLRRASEFAHRRGAAASVDDVLWVMLHYGRDLAVIHLLRRLTPDWQRAEWGRAREVHVPEPVHRPAQLVANDGVGARIAGIEDNLRLMQVEIQSERKLLMDLVRDIQRDVVAQRSDGAAFRGDIGQRLESLERTFQLRGDGGRVPLQLAERLGQLEKTVHASLGEATRATVQIGQRLSTLELSLGDGRGSLGQQAVLDRLLAVEKAVHTSLGEATRASTLVGQRLAALETAAIDTRSPAGQQAIADRLTALEKAVHGGLGEAMASRFAHLETAIGSRLTAIERAAGEARTGNLPEAVTARLAAIERRLETAGSETGRHWAHQSDRIEGIVRLVEATTGEASRMRLDLAERLDGIESQLVNRAGETAGTAVPRELVERIGGLERAVRAGFGDAAATATAMADRLAVVERSLGERPRDEGEALLLLDDRLGAIERVLETRGAEATSATHQIIERLHLLEQRPASMAGIDTTTLIAPLIQRLDGIQGQSLIEVNTRLAGLDERMRSEALLTEEALKGRDEDFDAIYGEIKQLSQSQAMLTSAVADWRSEAQGHFGNIAQRLDKMQALPAQVEAAQTGAVLEFPAVIKGRGAIEPTSADASVTIRPATASQSGAGAAAGAGQAGDRREGAGGLRADSYVLPKEPGRGFWYWLFGTDNVARANRENDLKVTRMRQNIRDAKERRRQV